MTYPHIGNYGVNLEDVESREPMRGFIVKEYLIFQATGVPTWSRPVSEGENKVGIEGIGQGHDHLRDNGVQMGIISTLDMDPHSLFEKRKHPNLLWIL
jgi:carbamoyl-phosphate synthase small subunit